MRPQFSLLEPGLADRVLGEAVQLLSAPGVRVESTAAQHALRSAGVPIDGEIARIPETAIERALATAPRSFSLHRRDGTAVVRYGGQAPHFDPGSCAVHLLDPANLEHRPSQADDLVRLVRLAEALEAFDAQSTCLVCHDVPEAIGDVYRLFLVLLHSAKPVVTGAFRADGVPRMAELLALDSGGQQALRDRPRAVFDVCPSPPLRWTEFAGQNLVDLGTHGIPAQIVSMPMAGATAPVTLLGSVVQHAAECLSGIVIHQAAAPGAPVVWGGAPVIFDMRTASTPVGAIETAMISLAYIEVGKHLNLPTHTYLGASDSKLVDAQAGLESGISALLGCLSRVDLISGAGMLDSLACMSAEKLVLDAEVIGMARRLLAGAAVRGETLATAAFSQAGLAGEFLKLKETRTLFRQEQHLPASVIDRSSLRAWDEGGRSDAFARAGSRVEALLRETPGAAPAAPAAAELRAWMRRVTSEGGMDGLPGA